MMHELTRLRNIRCLLLQGIIASTEKKYNTDTDLMISCLHAMILKSIIEYAKMDTNFSYVHEL